MSAGARAPRGGAPRAVYTFLASRCFRDLRRTHVLGLWLLSSGTVGDEQSHHWLHSPTWRCPTQVWRNMPRLDQRPQVGPLQVYAQSMCLSNGLNELGRAFRVPLRPTLRNASHRLRCQQRDLDMRVWTGIRLAFPQWADIIGRMQMETAQMEMERVFESAVQWINAGGVQFLEEVENTTGPLLPA